MGDNSCVSNVHMPLFIQPAPEHLSGSAIYSVPLLVEEEEETGSVTRIDDYVDQGTVFKEEEERADVFKEEEERADGQVEATSEQPGVPVQVPELSQEQLAHPALSQEQLVVPIHSESPEGHLNESAAADPSVQPDSQVELAVVDGSSQQQTTESDRVTSPSDASEHKPLVTNHCVCARVCVNVCARVCVHVCARVCACMHVCV